MNRINFLGNNIYLVAGYDHLSCKQIISGHLLFKPKLLQAEREERLKGRGLLIREDYLNSECKNNVWMSRQAGHVRLHLYQPREIQGFSRKKKNLSSEAFRSTTHINGTNQPCVSSSGDWWRNHEEIFSWQLLGPYSFTFKCHSLSECCFPFWP